MAWTITETLDKEQYDGGKLKMFRVKLACTSDANASDHDVGSVNKNIGNVLNCSYLYMVKLVPGTGGDAPGGAFDLDIEDDNNDHILDSDANIHTANSFLPGSQTLGVFPMILDKCSIVCATLGNGNKADFYLYFSKP
jgi:hypothetical protein